MQKAQLCACSEPSGEDERGRNALKLWLTVSTTVQVLPDKHCWWAAPPQALRAHSAAADPTCTSKHYKRGGARTCHCLSWSGRAAGQTPLRARQTAEGAPRRSKNAFALHSIASQRAIHLIHALFMRLRHADKQLIRKSAARVRVRRTPRLSQRAGTTRCGTRTKPALV